MATPTPRIDWDAEIVALQDLSMTAGRAHVLTAESLVNAINNADREGGALDQKILTAKLAAESVAALENLGALTWAVRHRAKRGLLRPLLDYHAAQAGEIHEEIAAGTPTCDVLRVPTVDHLTRYAVSEEDRANYGAYLTHLNVALTDAANIYVGKSPSPVVAYNKIKHGFVLSVRLDKLRPGTPPPGDWENDVNVITGVAEGGEIEYTVIPRTVDRLVNFVDCIKLHSETYRAIVDVVQFLWEHGVPLDRKQYDGD